MPVHDAVAPQVLGLVEMNMKNKALDNSLESLGIAKQTPGEG